MGAPNEFVAGSGSVQVLLTGGTGFLGQYLLAELQRRGVRYLCAGRSGVPALDLDDPDGVAAAAAAARAAGCDRVLHAAAKASMAACEQDPAGAQRANQESSGVLARAFPGACVFVSTDLVFDGRKAPYREDAQVAPLSVYGQTKAGAEREVLQHGGAVARMPLLFGRSLDGRRGATDMVRQRAAEPRVLAGPALTLFTNEWRSPLHVADAATALVDLVLAGASGIHHLPGPERIDRATFGQRFVMLHGLPTDLFAVGPCEDERRPRDVTLEGRFRAARMLQAMLMDS